MSFWSSGTQSGLSFKLLWLSSETSPHLDSLASRGILFEQAIASSSHTVESVPSLLSSTLPASHQMNDITSYLPSDLIIIPQVFKAIGYNTAAFSFNPYFFQPMDMIRDLIAFLLQANFL